MQQVVTFEVFGEIKDRGEDWAMVWGLAMPSDQDPTHLGALGQQGNIRVVGIRKFEDPMIFQHQRAYFVRKTTGLNNSGGPVPIRIYSLNPQTATEKELAEILETLQPLRDEEYKIKQEIAALEEKIHPSEKGRLGSASGTDQSPDANRPQDAQTYSGETASSSPTSSKEETRQDGSLYLTGRPPAAEQVPEWVPVYSPSRFQNPSFMGMGSAFIGGFELETTDPLVDVVAFYRGSFEAGGFVLREGSTLGDTGLPQSINAERKSPEQKVEARFVDLGPGTRVAVEYSQGR
jgi:hypothetical protein